MRTFALKVSKRLVQATANGELMPHWALALAGPGSAFPAGVALLRLVE